MAHGRAREMSGSRLRQDPKKRYSKDLDLLHTAISQNHHRKSNLARSVSSQNLLNKNIPMTEHGPGPERPAFRKWHSFQMHTASEAKDAKEGSSNPPRISVGIHPSDNLHTPAQEPSMHGSRVIQTSTANIPHDDNSVSPLTVLKDQYNIRRPDFHMPMTATPATDNSFNNLLDQNSQTHTELTTVLESRSSKSVFNRMSQIMNMAHASMHSLVPMLPGGDPENESLSGHMSSSNISNYQSESDTEEEEDDGDGLSQNKPQVDNWKSPVGNTQMDLSNDLNNFQDMLNEINDFQSNFVDKFSPSSSKGVRLNRTQQKILDYKELHSFDSSSTLNSLGPLSSALNLPAPSSVLNSYSMRIQSETITSQYTSIRLRFGSKVNSHMSTMKKYIGANTAVLGFINRLELAKLKGFGWISPNSDYKEKPPLNFENKDEIIKTMWDSEISQFFGSAVAEPSSQGSESGTSGIRRTSNEELMDNVDFAAIARGVKLRG
ncbi:uncharacterized protein CANTADRAFT_7353 [Suhomyces tanzawaensis NRRL Y-17324]|uniref:Uncharacterized protein n=1 Tax=Suhomyces tanzawaensis NRRL Y-17324 TaxID=984487 RepID=A0A1E4SEQ8_9ASCO|nr:uncharacterized protein CANTADRAFT_7353 [Suhomyces tanzawaensis NRRL Y-17324]ODV77872.1 hypothetical protein CANTADRAFT_7353 [Suhomyces tanzawaensis NRRL Y-17324]